MSALTVAVTGATGMIGRALCASLTARGHRVRALCRRRDPALAALPGVTLFDCDLPDRLEDAGLQGCDALVHAAYATRFRSRAEAERVNETGSRRLFARARAASVPRIVFVSSTSAHPAARSYYGQSKLRLEADLGGGDLVIRPGLVLSAAGGLFQRLAGGGRRTWFVPVFDGGRQPLQIIHIDDLCVGFRLALEGGVTGALTLASPEVHTMRAFFAAVAAARGRPVCFVPLPLAPALAAFRVAEALRLPLLISSENLLGLTSLRAWDTAPDLRRLGLEVRPLAEALASL
jgi:nucleoside-diphosphate-sugar epimerase